MGRPPDHRNSARCDHRLEQFRHCAAGDCRDGIEREIDHLGLDELDRSFLRALINVYDGGPAGIEAIAATLGEERDTLEEAANKTVTDELEAALREAILDGDL